MNRSTLLFGAAAVLLSACQPTSQAQNDAASATANAANAADASVVASNAANSAASASAAAAATAASSAANSAAVSANAANGPTATPDASAVSAPQTTAAADFVTKAASTDMYEIAAARLALKESTRASVKSFANMMIHDHTQSTANLKAAITASGQSLSLPQDLSPDFQSKIDALHAAPKGAFDRTYVSQMVDTHEQAKEVLGAYAANGDVSQLKAFAGKTLPVVRMHLAHAKSLQAKM